MASILERLDDLIRGSLHRFVDRALANNSLIFFDQDVRDMENAIKYLEDATASMYAAARANERRLAQHQQDVAQLEEKVEWLMAKDVEPTSERMMVARAELEAKRGLVVDTQAQIERQQTQYEVLAKRHAETKVIAQTLRDSRPRMESLLILSRAYRSVEQVELTLEALRGLGGDTQVAEVADSIYQRFHEAEARLAAIRQAEDLEMLAEIEQVGVDDQLAARRRRLGLTSEADAPAPSLAGRESTGDEAALPDAGPEPEQPVPEPPPDEAAPESPPAKTAPGPLPDEPVSEEPTPQEPVQEPLPEPPPLEPGQDDPASPYGTPTD
jgi:phage shock protein A